MSSVEEAVPVVSDGDLIESNHITTEHRSTKQFKLTEKLVSSEA
jgi:hypothetical protein